MTTKYATQKQRDNLEEKMDALLTKQREEIRELINAGRGMGIRVKAEMQSLVKVYLPREESCEVMLFCIGNTRSPMIEIQSALAKLVEFSTRTQGQLEPSDLIDFLEPDTIAQLADFGDKMHMFGRLMEIGAHLQELEESE